MTKKFFDLKILNIFVCENGMIEALQTRDRKTYLDWRKQNLSLQNLGIIASVLFCIISSIDLSSEISLVPWWRIALVVFAGANMGLAAYSYVQVFSLHILADNLSDSEWKDAMDHIFKGFKE